MSAGRKLYSINEVASIVGLSASSLRAWERRYALLSPTRTQGGHRLYSQEDLKLFWYVGHLRNEGLDLKEISNLGRAALLSRACEFFHLECGHNESNPPALATPGTTVAPRSRDTRGRGNKGTNGAVSVSAGSSNLAAPPVAQGAPARAGASARDAAPGQSPASANPVQNQVIPPSYAEILSALHAGHCDVAVNMLERIFQLRSNAREFADQALELMRLVGEAWARGIIGIACEHVLTNRVKHFLMELVYARHHSDERSSPMAVCAAFPGELHELGLLRAAIHLRTCGYRIAYLGTDVPIEELVVYLSAVRPTLLCLSVTCARPPQEVLEGLEKLDTLIGPLVSTVVGGSGIRFALSERNKYPRLALTENLFELERMARTCEGRASAPLLRKPHAQS